jgi:ribosomal protein S18 acetylase RimI-like enzyme
VIEIRSGLAADCDEVLTFWRSATTEPSTTDNASSLGTLIAHASESLVLALDNGEIIGTVIAGWDGWRGAMYRLAVSRSHRRRGIATALVGEGERRLATRGAARLHMIVAADQDEAQAFWTAVGYEPTDQFRFVKVLG